MGGNTLVQEMPLLAMMFTARVIEIMRAKVTLTSIIRRRATPTSVTRAASSVIRRPSKVPSTHTIRRAPEGMCGGRHRGGGPEAEGNDDGNTGLPAELAMDTAMIVRESILEDFTEKLDGSKSFVPCVAVFS